MGEKHTEPFKSHLFYLFLTVLGLHCGRLSLTAAPGGCSCRVQASHAVSSFVPERGLQACGFSSCGTKAQGLLSTGSRALAL